MRRFAFPAWCRPVARFGLALGLLILCAPGCATAPPELKLTSLNQHRTWRQDFASAYLRRDAKGNLDVVLVDRAAEKAVDGRGSSSPVRQVMHLRVLWTPARDMKAVATNAAIKWYVLSDNASRDVLEYSGTGFIAISSHNDGTATLTIQNALLKPQPYHGELIDPVGPANLEGDIVAHSNAQRVTQVLGNLQDSLAASTEARAAAAATDLHDRAADR